MWDDVNPPGKGATLKYGKKFQPLYLTEQIRAFGRNSHL